MTFNNNDKLAIDPWGNPNNLLTSKQPFPFDQPVNPVALPGSPDTIQQSDSFCPVDHKIDHLLPTEASPISPGMIQQNGSFYPADAKVEYLVPTNPSPSLLPNYDSVQNQTPSTSEIVEAWHNEYHVGDDRDTIEYLHGHEAEQELFSFDLTQTTDNYPKHPPQTEIQIPKEPQTLNNPSEVVVDRGWLDELAVSNRFSPQSHKPFPESSTPPYDSSYLSAKWPRRFGKSAHYASCSCFDARCSRCGRSLNSDDRCTTCQLSFCGACGEILTNDEECTNERCLSCKQGETDDENERNEIPE